MAAIFPKSSDSWLRIGEVIFAVTILAAAGLFIYFPCPTVVGAGYSPTQPVPFSHKLHAGDLGLDCYYCHPTVQRAAFAAVPATATYRSSTLLEAGSCPGRFSRRVTDLFVDVLADACVCRLSARGAHDARSPGFWERPRGRICRLPRQLSLNVHKPLMLHDVLTSIEFLTDASRSFLIVAPLRLNPTRSASESILVIV